MRHVIAASQLTSCLVVGWLVVGSWLVVLLSRSLNSVECSEDSDSDDDVERRRYDRKQNIRDVNDLRQSLRQRLVTNRLVFFMSPPRLFISSWIMFHSVICNDGVVYFLCVECFDFYCTMLYA